MTPRLPGAPESVPPQDIDASPTPVDMPGDLAAQAARSRRKEGRQIWLLVAAVAVFMALAQFTPLRAWVTNVQIWKQQVDNLGWGADLLFLAGCAFAVLIGLPRLPLCATAGLIFGFTEGTVLSLVGSTLGSFGAFIMARAGARRAVLARAGQWPWLVALLTQPSVMRVFWVRQLMLPGMLLNVLLGVSSVQRGTFLIGTLLGYLPLNVAFTLVGSGLGKGSFGHTLGQLLAALAVVNLAGWLVWRWVQRQRHIGTSS